MNIQLTDLIKVPLHIASIDVMFNIVYNSINHYKYIKGDNYKAD